jgi:hypothetical protein
MFSSKKKPLSETWQHVSLHALFGAIATSTYGFSLKANLEEQQN